MFLHIFVYLMAFAGIWVGAGVAIRSVENISSLLRISSFIVSFLVLGFFTSVSELSVGINSLIANDPEIYVGNLIGASIVIFMMIIPLLAICGGTVKINHEFTGFNLVMSLIVVAAPVVLSIDGVIDRLDSLISVILYVALVLCIQTKKSILDQVQRVSKRTTIRIVKESFIIIGGLALIFISSRFVVQQTLYFSSVLRISPFLISLLLISIGTNIPELSFVVRSAFMKNNQIAFGDYVGSAAFNTFLVGFLTKAHGRPVYLTNSYLVSLTFLIVGLIAFFFFARSKNSISRIEGGVLFLLYLAFLLTEVIIH